MFSKWEYCFVSCGGLVFDSVKFPCLNGQYSEEWEGKSFVLFLTRIGEQGWEMSGFSEQASGAKTLFFKRPVG